MRILAVLLSFAMLATSCKKDKDNDNPGTGGYPKEVTIEYRVTTTTSTLKNARVTVTNETGGTATIDAAVLPFSKKFKKTVKQYDVLTISGTSGVAGNLKLEILVNDKVVTSETYSSTSVVVGSTGYVFQ